MVLPGCGLWSIIGFKPSPLNITREPDVLPLLPGTYPSATSIRLISSHVKSLGSVENRVINFSFVSIHFILTQKQLFFSCKTNLWNGEFRYSEYEGITNTNKSLLYHPKIGILPPFTIYVYCDYQLITDCFLFGSIFGRNAVTIPNNGNSVLT